MGNGIETIDIYDTKEIQEIRIPQSMRINDNKVYLKKVGNSIFVVPYHNPWQNMFESVNQFTSDYMESRIQGSSQERDEI